MGLIRGALHLATYGAVSPKSKKQRMASMQLAAMRGKSEAEIKAAGGRNFDFVNEANLRAKQQRDAKRQRELRERQQAGLAGGAAVSYAPSDDPVNYHPVTVPGSVQLHLIYGDMPDALTLCGKSAAQHAPKGLSIYDVKCAVCREVACDIGVLPKLPPTLTGRCPKCFRSVVWYTQTDKPPVHTATDEVECPAGADSEEGAPVADEPDGRDGTGVAAELERLVALRASGMLDDEEFRAAKARIIHGGEVPKDGPPRWPDQPHL
jgi:hypothetical protein